MFEFEKEVCIVERLSDEGQLCGIHSWRAHTNTMRSERRGINEGKANLAV